MIRSAWASPTFSFQYSMTEAEFGELLAETDKCFLVSRIRQQMRNKDWFYSVLATPIKTKSLLLLGFNPGAKKGLRYEPQRVMPSMELHILKRPDLGSLITVPEFLSQYMPGEHLEHVIQGNYCFFRSESEADISDEDLLLCRPLFVQFMKLLQPRSVLCFSARAWAHMLRPLPEPLVVNVHEYEPVIFIKETRRVEYVPARGSLTIHGSNISVFRLPHPNYKIPGSARHQIWHRIFCHEGSTNDHTNPSTEYT